MKATNTISSILLAAGLGLSVATQAAVVSSSGAAGIPNGLAYATMNFDIGTDYPFTSFDIAIDYEPKKLSFDAGMSTVNVGANTYGFGDFLSLLAANTDYFLANPDPGNGMYSLSAFALNPIYVSGPVEITVALRLAQDFTSGTSLVNYAGSISGDLDEDLFSGHFSVSAVPEPGVWMLWLGGLGLLAMRRVGKIKSA